MKSWNNQRGYFEGWYLKQVSGEHSIAFIPSFNRYHGRTGVMLQVITEKNVFSVRFAPEECTVSRRPFWFRMGETVFCERGIRLKIHREGLSMEGILRFGPLTPASGDMMGPFRYVPWMECSHGILSMTHQVWGTVRINGETYCMDRGRGYLEKDRGKSFPDTYFWTQYGWEEKFQENSIMVAAAEIPMAGMRFSGCICNILYQGKEYRLATYLGARIAVCTEELLIIHQGRYRLEVEVATGGGQYLEAPRGGLMGRKITENIRGEAWYCLRDKEKTVFSVSADTASLESVAGIRRRG